MIWMKNTAGKKDAALTLMFISFMFSLVLALLGSIESFDINGHTVSFRSFDMGFATTVLIPLIGLFISVVATQMYSEDYMTIKKYG